MESLRKSASDLQVLNSGSDHLNCSKDGMINFFDLEEMVTIGNEDHLC